jgi:hypothetical protein
MSPLLGTLFYKVNMKNPFGTDCPYFYGDYFRGKKVEECRLLEEQPNKMKWEQNLCKNCPVPSIKRANACQTLVLVPSIAKSIFGMNKKIKITAYCSKSNLPVKVPEIGCGSCHPLPDVFEKK